MTSVASVQQARNERGFAVLALLFGRFFSVRMLQSLSAGLAAFAEAFHG
jgi:hypothetical protein